MSIIDDVFVLTDQKGKISLDEVCQQFKDYTRQSNSSALGRLAAKGFIKKISKGKKSLYEISKEGQDFITGKIKNIKTISQEKHDGSWQMIIFNIPEKSRSLRDLFRNQLVRLGFASLHNSVWLSFWDKEETIKKLIAEVGLEEKNVLIIKTSKLNFSESKKIAQKLMVDWKEVNKTYEKFIKKAEEFLHSKDKNVLKARIVVFEFAKAAEVDPKIPESILPKKSLANQAYKLYLKIRPYCYRA